MEGGGRPGGGQREAGGWNLLYLKKLTFDLLDLPVKDDTSRFSRMAIVSDATILSVTYINQLLS